MMHHHFHLLSDEYQDQRSKKAVQLLQVRLPFRRTLRSHGCSLVAVVLLSTVRQLRIGCAGKHFHSHIEGRVLEAG
jgi:hypothetical protein